MNPKQYRSIVQPARSRLIVAVLSLAILVIAVGCGSGTPNAESIVPTAVAAEPVASVEAEPTTGSVPFIGEAAPTFEAATAPPVVTAQPTVTPTNEPEPTAEGGVVPTPIIELNLDPAVTLVPFSGIEQPAYKQSDCSDKYPCNEDVEGWESRIQLPEGFSASYFARIEGQPNVMTFGPDGLYVATMTGEVYIVDVTGRIEFYVDGFNAPAGMAFQPGTNRLYIASRLVDLNVDGEARVTVIEDGVTTDLITGLPCCYVAMHSANGIAFGPDGYGYVAVGGRADHGEILSGPNFGQQDERHPYEASILRFSPDGSTIDVYARGFRNSYDIAWDADGNLYTTDNMPDYGPPEEFNLIVPGGEHGYPWFDCDVCFAAPDDVEIVPPLHTFVAHSAPTGITAYLDDDFPGYYNSLFVTLWSAFPEAQRILWFSPGGEEMETFATGFAAPIDLVVGPDGALYVADWATGIIFRIEYTGS